MVLVDGSETEGLVDLAAEPFPREVEFIISAMEAGPRPIQDRQQVRRTRYRVRATLRLFGDEPGSSPWVLYTRNISNKAMGFVSQRRLPLSHGGILSLPSPDGKPMQISCTVLRCREAAPGWFEGSVYFNRPQPCFDAERWA